MKYLVIPPYSDPTLLYEAPEGWQVYDLMQLFLKRILTKSGDRAQKETLQSPAVSERDERNRMLLLEGGRQLIERADHPDRWLRACGAILSGQPHSSAVHLRLDDLELVAGTTESSEDVQRAAEQEAPYTPELQRVCAELADAETILLVIDTDKQLPAVAWLAQALGKHQGLEISGLFANRYLTTLKKMPAFAQAKFVPLDKGYQRYVSQRFTGHAERLWWNANGELPEGTVASQGGAIPLKMLLEPETMLAQGIKVAVISFTMLGETVVDEWGQAFSHADLIKNVLYLRDHGVQIVAEWQIGAPGIGEEQIQSSLEALNKPHFFTWLAGIRRFHWPIDRQQTSWGSSPVTLMEPDTRLDLARTRPYAAPGTIEQERLPFLLDELALKLMQHTILSPGRVAGAYYAPPPDLASVGKPGTLSLDPDCVLIQLAGEDPAQTEWFAVNLRLHKVIAVDRRLIKMLLPLRNVFQPPALALPAIPEAQRSKVVTNLCRHGVLVEATL